MLFNVNCNFVFDIAKKALAHGNVTAVLYGRNHSRFYRHPFRRAGFDFYWIKIFIFFLIINYHFFWKIFFEFVIKRLHFIKIARQSIVLSKHFPPTRFCHMPCDACLGRLERKFKKENVIKKIISLFLFKLFLCSKSKFLFLLFSVQPVQYASMFMRICGS